MDRNSRSNQFVVIGITAWLSFNLIRRWMYTPIFLSAGPYGVPQPSLFDQTLIVVCSILCALLFALIGLGLGRLRGRAGRIAIGVFSLAALLALEGDFGWYMMSKSHITTGDLVLFATQNWHDHFGIQTHDITRFCMLALMHAGVIVAIFYADGLLNSHHGQNTLVARVKQLCGFRYLAHSLVLLLLVGQSVTMLMIGPARPLWEVVANANPFYVSSAGRWLRSQSVPREFVRLNEKVNAERVVFAGMERSNAQRISARTRPDILFVTIESWNANYANASDMPYFSSLEKSCHIRSNHYSGANQTELGVLSLLYGEPDVFFRGYRQYAADVRQSPYIAALQSLGYRIGRVVGDASQQNTIPRYLAGFNEPEVVDKDDWHNIGVIAARLARPGPDFIHAHYFQTHYPYMHAPAFSAHQPETPPDFSYQSFNMSEQRVPIINRYKNALSELDSWLEKLLGTIDLNETIVIVTGDHGEEIFETGRLGHSATVESPQVRTPLAICGPGAPPAGRSSALSSHADVFPTVFDMIGVHDRLSVFGKSLFAQEQPRLALIAKQNHGKPPVEWAVQLDQGELFLRLRDNGTLEVTGGDPKIRAALSQEETTARAGELDGMIARAIVLAEKELSGQEVAEKKLASIADREHARGQ